MRFQPSTSGLGYKDYIDFQSISKIQRPQKTPVTLPKTPRDAWRILTFPKTPRDAWRLLTLPKTPNNALRDLPKTPGDAWGIGHFTKIPGEPGATQGDKICSEIYEIT